MIFFDTNVLIDVLGAGDDHEAEWSRATYRHAADGPMVTNLVVLAELAGHATAAARLVDRLEDFRVEVLDLTLDACFAAGRAFADYRRRGGARTAMLADFLIAGHAATIAATLVTRDRRLGSYFNNLSLLTPEAPSHG